ncbi:8974_t:CDS:2, partial [Scutellospora calospora]
MDWNGHGAVLINNKLIIPPKTSESVGLNDDSNELLMLDMTSSFDSASSPWQNITPTNAPNISFHAMSTGGSKVVIWGGETPGEQPSNSLLYFDTITLQMNIQNSSSNPPGTIESSMVTRINDSVAYIYGGYTGSSAEVLGGSTPRSPSFSKNMYALNIDSGSFSLQSNTNNAPPQGLIQHSATILSNGKIYIIGGLIPGANGALSSMSKIYIFDTLQNTWSQLNATNPSPPNRRLHGAIGSMSPDNKIIIFGGADLNFLKYNDIAVLDTFNEILSWSLQNTTGTPPSARYAHTFTLVGNNAIVAF